MPISVRAAPLVPQQEFLDIDSERESWVYVLPATPQINLRRGELLKIQEFDSSGYFTRTIVNPELLKRKELWLASPASNKDNKENACHIVLAFPPESGEDEPTMRTFDFEVPEGGWTESKFYEQLDKLPPFVITSWSNSVRSVNRGWIFPFG